ERRLEGRGIVRFGLAIRTGVLLARRGVALRSLDRLAARRRGEMPEPQFAQSGELDEDLLPKGVGREARLEVAAVGGPEAFLDGAQRVASLRDGAVRRGEALAVNAVRGMQLGECRSRPRFHRCRSYQLPGEPVALRREAR